MKMRLLVSGGRDFNDVEFIVTHLNRLHKARNISELVHGAARGVDTICAMWADEVGVTPIPVPLAWRDDSGRLDRGAGHKRNQKMLDEYHPEALFAFPGGGGTADMVERAEKVLPEVWQSQWNFFKKECPNTWFLSNFAEGYGFRDNDGIWWDTSEHYYQAMKTPIVEEREYVRVASTPGQAKRRGGKEINITHDWDERKFEVMRLALEYKFAAGTEASGLLQCTGIDYLVEWAPWGDIVWGVNKHGKGANHLGRMLMNQREQL
jgi:ribA/ribD-fused uncharacterized protein